MEHERIAFLGTLVWIQPRIRLTRSFDEAYHTYLGYALTIEQEDKSLVSIGISERIHEQHQLYAGMIVSGSCAPVQDERMESVAYYRLTKFKVLEAPGARNTCMPYTQIPPSLAEYRERGCRRLASRTYQSRCFSCIWSCRMPVEIIVDQWNPHIRRYRYETFCYGPKACSLYAAGANRKVPGRKGMQYVEEDWVDELLTSNREEEE